MSPPLRLNKIEARLYNNCCCSKLILHWSLKSGKQKIFKILKIEFSKKSEKNLGLIQYSQRFSFRNFGIFIFNTVILSFLYPLPNRFNFLEVKFLKNYSTEFKSEYIFWKSDIQSISKCIHFKILSSNFWEIWLQKCGTLR